MKPLQLGNFVKVVKINKDDPPDDIPFLKRFCGRIGKVTGFDTEGCGATPDDPFIRVSFKDGYAYFWREELARRRHRVA